MPSEAPLPVFVSCATPHQIAQEDFISAVDAHLKSHGCEPITVGRTKYADRLAVEATRDCIAECHGAVIIATERMRVLKATKYPDPDRPKYAEEPIGKEAHPTIWNQMEAAMAYSKNMPMLILVQKGLKREGMLSDRFEWVGMEDDLSPALLRTEEFRQKFELWVKRVARRVESERKEAEERARKESEEKARKELEEKERRAPEEKKPGERPFIEIVRSMTTKEVWAALLIVFGVFSGVATTAFKLGQSFPGIPTQIAKTPASDEAKSVPNTIPGR